MPCNAVIRFNKGTTHKHANYLDLWPGHQQRDVLVALSSQQRHSILTVLDLNTVYLDG